MAPRRWCSTPSPGCPMAVGPFIMSDMGTADGGTSLDLVVKVIDAVKRRWPGREIAIVHTDQPRNDFNALVANVHRSPWPRASICCNRRLRSIARSCPQRTLDLGFSATAMHWLSSKPCDISNHVQAVGAKGAELEAFARQGNADWRTILTPARRRAEIRRPAGAGEFLPRRAGPLSRSYRRREHVRHVQPDLARVCWPAASSAKANTGR